MHAPPVAFFVLDQGGGMKRRNQNRESSPQSPLPFPDQLLPDNNASHPYKPGPPDSGILHHSSQELIQDAAPKPLSAARLTPSAIPEVLALRQQLHEQLGASSERGRAETKATDARRG